jgi:tyrosyl-tRNA synthetase
MSEIDELSQLKGEHLREAKEVLAYEATKICHGQKEAEKARKAARQLFGQNTIGDYEGIPRYDLNKEVLTRGIEAYTLFSETGLCKTRSEARRLISQGGAYINGKRVTSFETIVGIGDVENKTILLRAGKKNYLLVTVQE